MQSENELDKEQSRGITQALANCLELYGPSSLSNATKSTYNTQIGKYLCPAYFDTITCWPPTQENTTSIVSCPSYIVGFRKDENATRRCMENGTWFMNENLKFWSNYTNCFTGDETLVPMTIDMSNLTSHKLLNNYLPVIKIISQTGYTVSLLALIIAFLVMFFVKKLHCARNNLHMNLFASFIMRAAITLLKDTIFIEGIGLNSTILSQGGHRYFYENKESGNWACKFLTSSFNFFITANYSWILMEGLYLYNLIFRSMFADSNRKITQYIVLGWGVPLLVILCWISARIVYEDTFCWTTHDDTKMTFLIIRVPTAISILLNMVLFLRIAAVIYTKLQAPDQEDAKRYRKWARSTLVLAPLFGVHYALLIGMSSSINTNETVELIWLFADQLFASSQGFVVSILYCFLNGEVRAELKPHVHAFLLYVATHNYLHCLFPCRERYLRSTRGRTSVCTTMSCSSIFNNGVSHKGSRTGVREFTAGNKNDRSREFLNNSKERFWMTEENPKSSSRNFRRESTKLFSSNSNLQKDNLNCPESFKLRPNSTGFESDCMLMRTFSEESNA